MRKAVIVAAGMSSRLYPLTKALPKSLLQVGKESMIGRSVRLLRENGIDDVCIVTGCNRQKICQHLGGGSVKYLYNPFYEYTNNMASLWFARDWVNNEPFLYLHSDLVYDPCILPLIVDCREEAALLVEVGPTDTEAMKVRVVHNRFVESSKSIPFSDALGEWVGIALFSGMSVSLLFDTIEQVLEEKMFQAYDTEAFTRMASNGLDFGLISTMGLQWIEVDSQEDLKLAREMFGR